jgi:predicted Rossmann-fold nucleotide-binding protein
VTSSTTLLESLTAGPRQLAVLASLAGRVEAQLLRAIRLRLATHLLAADEADLWFSPIVETAAATGLVFRSEVLPELQNALSQSPILLEEVWRLLFRLRTGIHYADRDKVERITWLIIQEELTYWSLRGGELSNRDNERIRKLWAWVENSLQGEDERLATDANSWIERVRMRLPLNAWSLPGASRVSSASAVPSQPLQSIWVRLVHTGLELSRRGLSGGHRIDTAVAGPVRLSLVWHQEGSTTSKEIVVDRQLEQVKTDAVSFDLNLVDGQAFRLAIAEKNFGKIDSAARFSKAVVKIRRPNEAVVACGLLVSTRYVVLCAHAIKSSIKNSPGLLGNRMFLAEYASPTEESIGGRVEVIVPQQSHDSPMEMFSGTVVACSPFSSTQRLPDLFGPAADDFAVVRLDGEATNALDISGEMASSPFEPGSLVGRSVHTFGYSAQSNVGELKSGVVTGVTDGGFEIEFDSQILPGWSGSPVWDDSSGLLGLISSLQFGDNSDRAVKSIVVPVRPISTILAELPRHVLVVGSGDSSSLPDETRWPAFVLGTALARAGYVLVCGGWPGVDHVVARAFVTSLDAAGERLAGRIEQLVETASPPDFLSGVEPLRIPGDNWAAAMAQRADVAVLVGGLGGAGEVCRAAHEIGVPVIPIPSSGGDARHLYEELAEPQTLLRFPDRRALRGVEGPTASEGSAQIVITNVLEVIGECLDESSVRLYSQCAQSILWLLNQYDLHSFSWNAELTEFVAQLKTAGGAEALEKFDRPSVIAQLTSSLPKSGRWLVQDFFALTSSVEAWSGATQVQAILLRLVLSDPSATKRLEHQLVSTLISDPRTLLVRLQRLQALGSISVSLGDEAGRERVTTFLQQIQEQAMLEYSLMELRQFAMEFLAPAKVKEYGSSYRKIYDAAQSGMQVVTVEVTSRLILSTESSNRVIGYTFFLAKRFPDCVSHFMEAMLLEREEAEQRKETRPLWLLLQCIESCIDDGIVGSMITSSLTLPALRSLLLLLGQHSDIDPSRECYSLLSSIIDRLSLTKQGNPSTQDSDMERNSVDKSKGKRKAKPRKKK